MPAVNGVVGGRTLALPHGSLRLPAFLPDATWGVVRSVDSADLEACGIAAVVMNAFHLMQRPGSSTIRAMGGLHAFTGWRGPIVTDSGGFQAYSLIRQDRRRGHLSDRGITFVPDGGGRRVLLTPEKSVQLQVAFGADIVICLDDCTHPDDPAEIQERSVARTIEWARRCKAEFMRLMEAKRESSPRPRLFAVIQGGRSPSLRQRCADALLEMGFDGFGYGGWPFDRERTLLTDMLEHTRRCVPAAYPLHALGIGHPAYVATCVELGYELFDSSLPTRDARHGRLYAEGEEEPFSTVYVQDAKHLKARGPISPQCPCPCCTRYSLAWLHHLFKLGDPLYFRLATLHNLSFMVRWMERLATRRPGDG
ncbi:MAG TPA: tRNA guanosine(34) transglycosylase Tgt [Limnochordia bacterium]